MKIIYVWGDDDYTALGFEQDFGIEKAKQMIADNPDKQYEFAEGCYFKVIDAGEPSEEFIDLIRDELIDYDAAKYSNFYIL